MFFKLKVSPFTFLLPFVVSLQNNSYTLKKRSSTPRDSNVIKILSRSSYEQKKISTDGMSTYACHKRQTLHESL